LFLVYFILKEFIILYSSMKNIHPYLGYGVLIIIFIAVLYFVTIPLLRIIFMPRNLGPMRNKKEEESLIIKRIISFKQNSFLMDQNQDFTNLEMNKSGYDKIIKIMDKECNRLRKQQVSQLFYTTTIVQNGFLDALLILAACINHVKEIFILYNGRVTNRDLWQIAKKIYYSMVIGGSEGVEYATQEIISKFASDGLKSIPFIDKILSSLADGFVNAALLTRVSYITENYCKLTFIKSDRDLYPSPKFIFDSAKNITADFMNRIFSTLRKMALKFTLNKSFDYAKIAVNPIGYVLSNSIDKSEKINPLKKEKLKEQARLAGNPLAYGLGKLIKSLKKK